MRTRLPDGTIPAEDASGGWYENDRREFLDIAYFPRQIYAEYRANLIAESIRRRLDRGAPLSDYLASELDSPLVAHALATRIPEGSTL